MDLTTVSVLSILFVSMATRGQSQECCNAPPNCNNISTMNITIKQFAEGSPYFEPTLSTDDIAVTYKSVCVTYFPVISSLFLEFRSIQLKNGSNIISVHLTSDLSPGVFRVHGLFKAEQGNSTTVHNFYVVDATCQRCQPLYMYYKCFIYDSCEDVIDIYDVVNGRSSSADNNAPACLDEFEALAVSKGFDVRGFVRPPSDSYSCVTRYGNSKCINYNKVATENSISYPLGDGC